MSNKDKNFSKFIVHLAYRGGGMCELKIDKIEELENWFSFGKSDTIFSAHFDNGKILLKRDDVVSMRIQDNTK